MKWKLPNGGGSEDHQTKMPDLMGHQKQLLSMEVEEEDSVDFCNILNLRGPRATHIPPLNHGTV